MKDTLYNLCNQKRGNTVTVKYISLSGREHTVQGTMLLPLGNFVELRIKLYLPAGGSYILQIAENRIIQID